MCLDYHDKQKLDRKMFNSQKDIQSDIPTNEL